MIYTFENPKPAMEFAARLNTYAYESCKATHHPSGWCECGRTGHIVHYLGRCGSLDLYINYDSLADIFVGHTWD